MAIDAGLIWMVPTLAGGSSTPLAYAVPPAEMPSARSATDAGQWRRIERIGGRVRDSSGTLSVGRG